MSGILRNATTRCLTSFRNFSKNAIRYDKPVKAAEEAAAGDILSKRTHRPDNLEKRMLVWTKKYKSVEEVPAFVSQETMERARNRTRIRLANIMMALTAVGCVIMIFSGKKAVERGDSVQKANIEWHKRVREEEEKSNK